MVIEGQGPPNIDRIRKLARVEAAAHPRDVIRDFRMSTSPLVIIARQNRVLAAGVATKANDVEALYEAAVSGGSHTRV